MHTVIYQGKEDHGCELGREIHYHKAEDSESQARLAKASATESAL